MKIRDLKEALTTPEERREAKRFTNTLRYRTAMDVKKRVKLRRALRADRIARKQARKLNIGALKEMLYQGRALRSQQPAEKSAPPQYSTSTATTTPKRMVVAKKLAGDETKVPTLWPKRK